MASINLHCPPKKSKGSIRVLQHLQWCPAAVWTTNTFIANSLLRLKEHHSALYPVYFIELQVWNGSDKTLIFIKLVYTILCKWLCSDYVPNFSQPDSTEMLMFWIQNIKKGWDLKVQGEQQACHHMTKYCVLWKSLKNSSKSIKEYRRATSKHLLIFIKTPYWCWSKSTQSASWMI